MSEAVVENTSWIAVTLSATCCWTWASSWQVAQNEKPSAAMLIGRYEIWHTWKDNPNGQDSECVLRVVPDTLVQPPQLALACDPLRNGPAPSMSDLIVRKHVIEQIAEYELFGLELVVVVRFRRHRSARSQSDMAATDR